jgi:hypothetical protein
MSAPRNRISNRKLMEVIRDLTNEGTVVYSMSLKINEKGEVVIVDCEYGKEEQSST